MFWRLDRWRLHVNRQIYACLFLPQFSEYRRDVMPEKDSLIMQREAGASPLYMTKRKAQVRPAQSFYPLEDTVYPTSAHSSRWVTAHLAYCAYSWHICQLNFEARRRIKEENTSLQLERFFFSSPWLSTAPCWLNDERSFKVFWAAAFEDEYGQRCDVYFRWNMTVKIHISMALA